MPASVASGPLLSTYCFFDIGTAQYFHVTSLRVRLSAATRTVSPAPFNRFPWQQGLTVLSRR